MKNFVAQIVWLLKRDMMIVIMFMRNFKNKWGVNLGVFVKRI